MLPVFHICHPPMINFTGPVSNINMESSKFDIVVEHYVHPLMENVISFGATLGTRYQHLARKPWIMVSVTGTVMAPRIKSTISPACLTVNVGYIASNLLSVTVYQMSP